MHTQQTNGGLGFLGLLTLIFITLRLLEKITWSWWWVLSPIWIPIAFGMIVILIVLVFLDK
jgi:hypothetical protein